MSKKVFRPVIFSQEPWTKHYIVCPEIFFQTPRTIHNGAQGVDLFKLFETVGERSRGRSIVWGGFLSESY